MTKEMMSPNTLWKSGVRLMTSYGLATVVLVFMLIVTLLGTLEQTKFGIHEVQKRYFESLFVVHWFGKIPLPLPGGMLLMSLLFLNLLAGTILRVRRNPRAPGLFISHVGILFLLLSGFVTFKYSTKGAMVLYEGQTSNLFSSYYDWQIEIARVGEDGKIESTSLVISKNDLKGIQPDEKRIFRSDKMPFDFHINGYARNARVLEAGPEVAKSLNSRVVDGFVLSPLELDREAARNVPGAYVALVNPARGEEQEAQEAILWGMARYPATFDVGGEKWVAQLIKDRWVAPFSIKLNQFTHEYYPKTRLPRVYASDVTKTENGVEEEVEISMNRPLRHEGYTFYQESWGPDGGPPNAPVWSQLAVSRNPADQWPMWSCWIVGFGLLIHFIQKLGGYLASAKKKRMTAAS